MKISRRGALTLTALAGQLIGPVTAKAGTSGLRPVQLKVDGLDSPMGLEALPRFSWQLVGSGLSQSAYRIGVAATEAGANQGIFDVWDSGKVISPATFDIAYEGRALRSGERAWWSVEIWDEKGQSSGPSTVSWWEMGLLEPWTAQWIVAEAPSVTAQRGQDLNWIWGAEATHKDSRKFRWSFTNASDSEAALLNLSAKDNLLGLWLDGQSILPKTKRSWGLGPVFDLGRLRAGTHVLAVEVNLRLDEARPVIAGALAALLRLTTADGVETRLHSDTRWSTTLDAKDGWQAPAFDDREWPKAQPVTVDLHCTPWPWAPPVRLRRELAITKTVARARLRATALGAYELTINGKRVGDALLTPESTDFRTRALYQTFDVLDLLQAGANAIGATVADGWFASPFSFLELRYAFGDPPRRFMAQLELIYSDGSSEIIATDNRWKLGPSPILRSEIYNGEIYDARLDERGWDSAGFDDDKWIRAQIGTAPGYVPTAQTALPIRRIQVLSAKSISTSAPGICVFDFGQNFAGWCQLKVKGNAGTVVRLRFAEAIDAEGNIDVTSNRRAEATDTYILKGDPAGEVWEPRFTFHGFQYVEVTGLEGAPTAEQVIGIVIHSDVAFTGHIKTTNNLIDNLWRNTFWSQRSNFVGIPTDCPQRDERMGWTGDAEIFWDAGAFNMDVDAFTRRFCGDLRAGQLPSGEGADVAPYWALGQNTPGWADALIVLPWTVWQRYGDTRVIQENWDAMTRFGARLEALNPDFVWRNKRGMDYGDWLSVDAKSREDVTTPKELIATAMWARSTFMLASMGKAIHRESEAKILQSRWRNIVDAFKQAFIRSDGSVGNDSQTSHILALNFGLMPEALRAKSASKLAADVQRRGIRLSTGFIGTPFILDALADNGKEDLAIALLLQVMSPSWGAMVNSGSTTMWEQWRGIDNGKVNSSLNHYAFGAINGFVYRRLGGIDAAAPGFSRIAIRPLFPEQLNGFGATYDSVVGRVATSWRRADNRITFTLTVPPNALASLELPTSYSDVAFHGNRVRKFPLELPAGEHQFVLTA